MNKYLLIILFTVSGALQAQNINIPDADFKSYLLNNTVADADNNGEIHTDEALTLTSITLTEPGLNIASMEGIQYFTNLVQVTATNQASLTFLPLSGLSNLETIDVSGAEQLTTLNLSGCSAIESIIINESGISSLNINGCENLTNFDCRNTDITSLDLSAMELLETIRFGGNLALIDTIILGNKPVLIDVEYFGGYLTSLDLSSVPGLFSLIVIDTNQQLQNLNLKNGNEIYSAIDLQVGNDSDTLFICVDEGENESLPSAITDNPAISVSSYCSFVPGGNYNTIEGTVTFDLDDDGCDTDDAVNSFIKVNVSGLGSSNCVFTDAQGEYNYYTQSGNYIVTPEFENNYFTAIPSIGYVNFPTVNNLVQTQDFCISQNGVHPDIEVVMVPLKPAQPGFDADYKIVYKNKGNTTLSGSISCEWDYLLLDVISMVPVADVTGADTYTWNFTDLKPFENREIKMTFNINSASDSPAVNIDDVLIFNASAQIPGTDEDIDDNNFTLNQLVVGSYNENNIICIQGETVSPDAIGDFLHYVVNFKNTGNAAADFVVVEHIIDETKFDVGSLQLLNASHEVDARVTGNVIEFIFDNINLAAADHGNILFKVKSKSNLMQDDTVTNNANIYFDYNIPVQTNDANTTFALLNNTVFETDLSIAVYPNPANNKINLTADTNITSVELYDTQGRLLQVISGTDSLTTIDISANPAGVYFVKISTEEGNAVRKIIKR